MLAVTVTPVVGAGAFASDLPDAVTAYAASLLISLIAFSLALNETQRLAFVRGGAATATIPRRRLARSAPC